MKGSDTMRCDYCHATEEEIRRHYELDEEEELTWYCLGPDGEITVCEMCYDDLH